jgi:esterase/lipase
MKIKLIGNRENPAVVLIHGMFCDYHSVMHFAKYLQDDYFLILPTLDGHYPDSKDFTTAAKQARILTIALEKMDIEKISMIHGTSVGAVVALEMAKVCTIPVDSYFFDAGSFFHLTGAVKKIMYNRFIKFSQKFRGAGTEDFMQGKFVRWFCGDNPENYSDTIHSIINTLDFMTENSAKNIAEACYNCHLPSFEDDVTKKFMFNFSDKEPAHKCKKRLEKKYPLALFSGYSGNNYCGFQTNEPERYAHFLKGIIDNAI